MIIIVSTPLRIAASYLLTFAVGAAVSRRWKFSRSGGNPSVSRPVAGQ